MEKLQENYYRYDDIYLKMGEESLEVQNFEKHKQLVPANSYLLREWQKIESNSVAFLFSPESYEWKENYQKNISFIPSNFYSAISTISVSFDGKKLHSVLTFKDTEKNSLFQIREAIEKDFLP